MTWEEHSCALSIATKAVNMQKRGKAEVKLASARLGKKIQCSSAAGKQSYGEWYWIDELQSHQFLQLITCTIWARYIITRKTNFLYRALLLVDYDDQLIWRAILNSYLLILRVRSVAQLMVRTSWPSDPDIQENGPPDCGNEWQTPPFFSTPKFFLFITRCHNKHHILNYSHSTW